MEARRRRPGCCGATERAPAADVVDAPYWTSDTVSVILSGVDVATATPCVQSVVSAPSRALPPPAIYVVTSHISLVSLN